MQGRSRLDPCHSGVSMAFFITETLPIYSKPNPRRFCSVPLRGPKIFMLKFLSIFLRPFILVTVFLTFLALQAGSGGIVVDGTMDDILVRSLHGAIIRRWFIYNSQRMSIVHSLAFVTNTAHKATKYCRWGEKLLIFRIRCQFLTKIEFEYLLLLVHIPSPRPCASPLSGCSPLTPIPSLKSHSSANT